MTKSPAPCISTMSKPPPGVNTGNAVLCAVSLAKSVVVMVTPACIRPGASSATTVLPRSTPCWSAKEKRTSSSLCFLIACTAALAARACSPVHRPCRSTKLAAVEDRRAAIASPYLPLKGGGRRGSVRWGSVQRARTPPRHAPHGVPPLSGEGQGSMPIHPALGLLPAGVGALPIALPIAGRADAVDAGRAGDFLRRSGIEHHHRFHTVAGLIERLAQQTPISADRLVGGAEMLRRAVLDRAHRLADPLVVHVDVGAHAGKGRVFL